MECGVAFCCENRCFLLLIIQILHSRGLIFIAIVPQQWAVDDLRGRIAELIFGFFDALFKTLDAVFVVDFNSVHIGFLRLDFFAPLLFQCCRYRVRDSVDEEQTNQTGHPCRYTVDIANYLT